MKKIVSFLLATAIFCSASVPASAMSAKTAQNSNMRTLTSASVQPRLNYILTADYGLDMVDHTADSYASLNLFAGDGCKITAELQMYNSNTNRWSKVTSYTSGKVSGTDCGLQGKYPSCMSGKSYRTKFTFYAYQGSTVKEQVSEYSTEEMCW